MTRTAARRARGRGRRRAHPTPPGSATERELRWIVEGHPNEAYARLMLGRTLQRLGRREEAASWLRIAEALGAKMS